MSMDLMNGGTMVVSVGDIGVLVMFPRDGLT
ncbi:hypothetical protein Godav_026513 [Gossypium davidsonii]|uniref:Uncharacterized protein n=1 Tax=Gossypium davidsonii TaxID=34287 RepID=A0A7J8RUN3_GOSDV|nr:hypothetical protein [Gossypium davidsonii]